MENENDDSEGPETERGDIGKGKEDADATPLSHSNMAI